MLRRAFFHGNGQDPPCLAPQFGYAPHAWRQGIPERRLQLLRFFGRPICFETLLTPSSATDLTDTLPLLSPNSLSPIRVECSLIVRPTALPVTDLLHLLRQARIPPPSALPKCTCFQTQRLSPRVFPGRRYGYALFHSLQ